jgi:hypothetical protein
MLPRVHKLFGIAVGTSSSAQPIPGTCQLPKNNSNYADGSVVDIVAAIFFVRAK